jgi:hypothetical protein
MIGLLIDEQRSFLRRLTMIIAVLDLLDLQKLLEGSHQEEEASKIPGGVHIAEIIVYRGRSPFRYDLYIGRGCKYYSIKYCGLPG